MDLLLRDRVILVVGGAGYIGSAVVAALHAEHATVVVASRRAGNAGISIDARDQASVDDGVAEILRRYGRIDGLIFSAGAAAQTFDPSRSNHPDQVLDAIDAKALSFLRVANAVTPHMRHAGFGRVVGISGQHAFQTENVAASLRNAALILAAKNLADALGGTGVAINTISPGAVVDEPAREVEVGRAGESSPTQIADLAAFLLSPRAAISGESIAVGHRMRGLATL